MNNFQLYYLCEPDTDEVRYVGITKNGLKKKTIPTFKKSNIYNLNKDNIITYLNSGLNYIQIGNKHGCSNKIIHKFIKKHKLYVK